MKILFVSAALTDTGTATGILIGNMAERLTALGHKVAAVGIKRSLYDPDETDYRGMKVYHAEYVTSFRGKKKGKDFLLAAAKKALRHNKRNAKALFDSWQVRALVRKMKKIHAENYDAIVAVCASHDAIKAVQEFKAKASSGAKCVLIQYDPLAENFGLQQKGHSRLLEYEKSIFEKCDTVMTAPFILNGKDVSTVPKNLIKAEIPAVVPKKAYNDAQKCDEGGNGENNVITCVYAGDLYPGIRDPYSMLDLFALFENPAIQLHVIGGGAADILKKYSEDKLKGRLFIHGRLSEEECNRELMKADILINLGNKINNQLPSKVLNYACYGKPILNIYSISDCPTLEYLSDYPLAINVFGDGEVSDAVARQVENSILEIKDKRLEFSDVEKIYERCTPRYVVDQLLRALT